MYIGKVGSVLDARVLRKSPLYEKAIEDPKFFGGYFLLGDSAYKNLSWLVCPFKDNGHLTANQKLFNFRYSSTRIQIENAFGLLKTRFWRLLSFNNLRIDIIVRCIMAACVLHNICITMNNDDSDDDLDIDLDCENDNEEYNYDNIIVEDRRAHIFNRMFA